MNKQEEVFVDIDKVFKEKNPAMYRWVPKFIMSYIKRVVHQKQMNEILKRGESLDGIEFSKFVLEELQVKVTYEGLENFPEKGPVILASNHPLGGLDGVALIALLGDIRQDLKFIVNELLTKIPNFKEIFVPVNKLGSNPKANLEFIDRIYASDQAVVVFPAGLCSRKIKNKIVDLPWQKSFVSKAIQYDHPVLPVCISAINSNWFYNIANYRKRLGIKANVEMFWLVDEMFKQKGKTIKFSFGKPVPPEHFDKSRSMPEWSSLMREFVYKLENDPKADFIEYSKNSPGN
ncbi:MAG: 1-acyl-sn-glycerol-3-phosphate acyltransferase [Flavobacteriales bacterium]|nr:1-acyl-sn-glycerol-3-phosphate acyltransferase [Flavobacteriales bacterium]